jgi:hypothetical protein
MKAAFQRDSNESCQRRYLHYNIGAAFASEMNQTIYRALPRSYFWFARHRG